MAPKRNLHIFEANEQKVISHVINEQVDRKVLIEAFLLRLQSNHELVQMDQFHPLAQHPWLHLDRRLVFLSSSFIQSIL